MNRVVNIELAGQVFWIEEQAGKRLFAYLETIQQQLETYDFSEDIQLDIELRLAELFFASVGTSQKPLQDEEVRQIIEQVGYLDTDTPAKETSRKFYLAPNNKIIAGVCSGLANWQQIPVVWVRVVFLMGLLAFGAGALVYLILWLTLDASSNRNTILASQGKVPTAKQIALAEEKEEDYSRLEKTLFAPFAIVAKAWSSIVSASKKHAKTLTNIMKVVGILLMSTFTVIVGKILFSLSERYLFDPLMNGLFIFSLALFTLMTTVFIIRRFYLKRHHNNLEKLIILFILLPLAVMVSSNFYLEDENSYETFEVVNKEYQLNHNSLIIKLIDNGDSELFTGKSSIRIQAVDEQPSKQLTVSVKYFSRGSDSVSAQNYLRNINYQYDYFNGVLSLNQYFTLTENSLFRGQKLTTLISLPEQITLSTPFGLKVVVDDGSYYYVPDYEDKGPKHYQFDELYLHETSTFERATLDFNAHSILVNKFCSDFFTGEIWHCERQIQNNLESYGIVKPAYKAHTKELEHIRLTILEKNIPFEQLKNVQQQLSAIDLIVESEFKEYINYLIKRKQN